MRGDPPGSPGVVDAMNEIWDKRLRRSGFLASQWPFAADVLRFFTAVTGFQGNVARAVGAGLPRPGGAEPAPLRLPASFPPALIEIVQRDGPPELRRIAGGLESRSPADWEKHLATSWEHRGGDEEGPSTAFFPRALLQPWAAAQALRWREANPGAGDGGETCPFCGRLPVVSVLREDKLAEAVARALVCSLCSLEWSFTRVLCPGCREEKPERLPRLAADEIPWIRVEACDACGRYLKAVDLTKDPAADPVTDEIASTPLDVVAAERGYAKLQVNIVGF